MQSVTCSVCEKKSSKTCSLCNVARYCSPECQKIDWKVHKSECKTLDDYDPSTECNAICACILNSSLYTDKLGLIAVSKGHVSVIATNKYEIRMALSGRFKCNQMSDLKQVSDVSPYSFMGLRNGKEFLLHVQVGKGQCAHMAYPIAYDEKDSRCKDFVVLK